MYIKKKKVVDFICRQTYKNPLQDNSISKLYAYILQQNNYKINKSRC